MIALTVFLALGSVALLGFVLGRRRAPAEAQGPVAAPAPARREPPARPPDDYRQEMAILSSSVLGMAERMERLAQQVHQATARMDELEQVSATGGAYTPAIKMAERGCAVEDLVENFGLPRGEAELLRKLHGAADPGQAPEPARAQRRH